MPGGTGGLAGPVSPPVSLPGFKGEEDVGTRTETVPSGEAAFEAGANGSVTPGGSVASSARPSAPSPTRSVGKGGGGVPAGSAGNGGG